jgi:hypothetical protein
MSWKITVAEGHTIQQIMDGALDALQVEPEGAGQTPGPVADQIAEVKKAAIALLATGAFGSPETEVHGEINGHANPDHTPPAAEADVDKPPHDYVNISFKQTGV